MDPADYRISNAETEIKSLRVKSHDLSTFLTKLGGEFDAHAKVCGERYKAIDGKLGLIIAALKWAGGLVVLLGIAAIVYYLKRYGVQP